jgi:hypothetical protein
MYEDLRLFYDVLFGQAPERRIKEAYCKLPDVFLHLKEKTRRSEKFRALLADPHP